MGMLANGQAYRLLKLPLIWTPKTMHGQKKCHLGSFWNRSILFYTIRFKSQSTDWSVNTNWSNLVPRKSLAFANVDDNHYVGRIRRKNFQGDRIISSYTLLYSPYNSYTPSYPSCTHVYEVILSCSIWFTDVSLHYTMTFLGPLLSRYIQL